MYEQKRYGVPKFCASDLTPVALVGCITCVINRTVQQFFLATFSTFSFWRKWKMSTSADDGQHGIARDQTVQMAKDLIAAADEAAGASSSKVTWSYKPHPSFAYDLSHPARRSSVVVLIRQRARWCVSCKRPNVTTKPAPKLLLLLLLLMMMM